MMQTRSFLSLLQFSDGLFPSGGFAHSFGLEYDVQAGRISDLDGVEAFLRSHLEGAAGPCDAGAVVAAMTLGQAQDLEGALALDETLDAMKGVAEFREASSQMGRQTLRVGIALTRDALLPQLQDAVESGRTPGHHALVFGLIGNACGWRPGDAAMAYLYSTASMIVAASLRLLAIGQLDGQRLLASVGPLIERLAEEAQAPSAGPETLWSFAPDIEIAGMRHATLDGRLFRS